ncbi:MAG: hypothetical protein ACXAC7_09205 [Candidatus Hodarchaeales archaeon]|jgi:hypothetical protein
MEAEKTSIKAIEYSDEEETSFHAWLSLINFPDDTKVQLTRRGRSFIFQSAPYSHVIELIGRANWNRYRSNIETPIPLGIVRALLNHNEKDEFIASFSVTALGSQKLQIPLRIPLKVHGSLLHKILALMCLTRNVFNTGNFQTDNEEKATALVETFNEIFGVKLPKGTNKRGAYIRIPVQVVQAFTTYFTGKPKASFFEILESIQYLQQEDILLFLNTWFSFYRVYRNIKRPEQLFIFRKTDITEPIALLLEKCGIEFDPGTIQESGQIVSVYVIKKTQHNLSLLDLPFFEKQNDQKMLLNRIDGLRKQIKAKDEKIDVLEDLTTKLKDELAEEHQIMLTASYSQYYFETKTKKLEEKFAELKQIKKELAKENLKIKDLLKSKDPFLYYQEFIKETEYPSPDIAEITEKTLEIVKNEIQSSKVFDTQSFEAFVEYVESEGSTTTTPKFTWMVRGEDDEETTSRPIKSNLANPTLTSNLIRSLTLLMARKENWVLLALADGKPRTEFEIRDILGIDLAESRRLLASFTDKTQLDSDVKKNGEPAYQIQPDFQLNVRIELKEVLRKLPLDIRSQWKELFQL